MTLPTKLKIVRGSDKRIINRNEPKFKQIKRVPKAPTWLSVEAKAEWKRVAPILIKLDILTEGDISTFAAYCSAYGKLVVATKFIENVREHMDLMLSLGCTEIEASALMTTKSATIHAKMHNDSIDQMIKLGNLFGLSPVARSKIKVPNRKSKSNADLFTE